MSDSTRKGSLLVVFLAVFIDLLGFGMVLPLLPVYARDLAAHLDEQAIGWTIGLLMASFSAMQFLFAPLWGRVSDRIGRRPVLMIGLGGSVVCYTIFGIATVTGSLLWLFVSRIGAGIAGATISTAHAYIADTTTPETRTRGMALIGAAFGLGFTFGPLLGMLAVIGDPLRPAPWPGYLAAGLSAVALLLAWRMLPESLSAEHEAHARPIFDFGTFLEAVSMPSIGLLLATSFVCVLSFANFEATLSLLLREEGAFAFNNLQLLGTFAYIGLVLTVVQGGLVRRLAKTVDEVRLAATGAVLQIGGFGLLAVLADRLATSGDALYLGGLELPAGGTGIKVILLGALAVIVSGFAFITPSLNSLISRRSDPARQGSILGVAQSISSLARIVGPVIGAKLLLNVGLPWPYRAGAALMALGLAMLLLAARSGRDYQ